MLNNKPKLVVLSAFYEPYMSGAEQMVREVLTRLGDKYDISLVTGRFDKANPVIEDRPNFKLIRVGIGHKQLDKLLYIFLAALKVREIQPRIAHAIMESYAGGALVLVKWLAPKVRRILTLQSGDLDDPSKGGRKHQKIFWKIIHTSPDIVTAISSSLAKRAEKLGVKKENIYITPNGYDQAEVEQKVEKENSLVISMGRLSWEKGFEYLLDAWPDVIVEVPEARLEIWGEGNLKNKLLDQISEHNIDDSVVIKDLVPHDEFIKQLKRAQIYVQASLAEGLGMVFIESQACGVPPIGTRVGGIPDVIQHEENGLLVEPKNKEAIRDAMIRLLKDDDLRNRLVENGLETSKKFEWNNIINKIDKIYQELNV